MIYVSHATKVNAAGKPSLDRAAVWDGLVLKANNALHSDTVFDRDIDFRGQRFTERITLEAPHRVVFTRIAGPVLGTIANEIQGTGTDLQLRFSYALVIAGLEGGSDQEKEYADGMTDDYLKAVETTVAAMRRVAINERTSA